MITTNMIGISEDRMRHMLGVARKAYRLSLEMQLGRDFAMKMFVLGLTHDIGYEFVPGDQRRNHPDISALILAKTGMDRECISAVRMHGRYTEEKSPEWEILNMADMTVDSKGNEVSVVERLEDIRIRYGEYSDEYLTACDICFQTGLTAVNLAARIT